MENMDMIQLNERVFMKKIFKCLLVCILGLSLTTGCFKRDDMENIKIYTTVYPITYIINALYGNYSTITSIYPNNVDINNYELTDKQINDYSKGNLFIYNVISNENKNIYTLSPKQKASDLSD